MNYLGEIVKRFPVRRSAKEKSNFRQWAVKQAHGMGYEARVEENGTKRTRHQNVVIGDPDHAAVIFTAHYDTPAISILPNIMMPRNIPLFWAYQFVVVGIMIALSIPFGLLTRALGGSPRLSQMVFLVVYCALLFLLLRGPANKHNVNDNTSGVAAVMALMERIPKEHREKAAFILFDNEEKGKLGSKAYAKEHLQTQFTRLMINMDCVGVGDTLLVISKKMAKRCLGYATMQSAMEAQTGRKVRFFDAFGSVCNSDQANFKCGVAICACKKAPVVGYYTPKIHTRRDTEADEENIQFLAEGLGQFVENLSDA